MGASRVLGGRWSVDCAGHIRMIPFPVPGCTRCVSDRCLRGRQDAPPRHHPKVVQSSFPGELDRRRDYRTGPQTTAKYLTFSAESHQVCDHRDHPPSSPSPLTPGLLGAVNSIPHRAYEPSPSGLRHGRNRWWITAVIHDFRRRPAVGPHRHRPPTATRTSSTRTITSIASCIRLKYLRHLIIGALPLLK
jgi:hypothetical protein